MEFKYYRIMRMRAKQKQFINKELDIKIIKKDYEKLKIRLENIK